MDACICPLPAALTSVPNQACPEDLGQIQKAVFQRRGTNFVTAVNAITALASWTAYFAAVGNTKTVITPFFESATITPPEAVTEGGNDNTTLDGNELVVGETNPIFNATFRSIQHLIVKAMRSLRCEDLVVYLINEYGQIIGSSTDNGVNVTGIPIKAFYIGTSGNEGKNTNDKAPMRFTMSANWRDTIWIANPIGFNAKTDLVNP
jgi:hypothetical protein